MPVTFKKSQPPASAPSPQPVQSVAPAERWGLARNWGKTVYWLVDVEKGVPIEFDTREDAAEYLAHGVAEQEIAHDFVPKRVK